jgi:hypothetical protein
LKISTPPHVIVVATGEVAGTKPTKITLIPANTTHKNTDEYANQYNRPYLTRVYQTQMLEGYNNSHNRQTPYKGGAYSPGFEPGFSSQQPLQVATRPQPNRECYLNIL